MKLSRIALSVLAITGAAVLLAACRQAPPEPGSPDPSAEEYSVATKALTDMKNALSEMEELNEPEGIVRGVLSPDGLTAVLDRGEDKQILYKSETAGVAAIGAGDYTDRDFTFDSAVSAAVCDGDVGRITLKALNEEGFTLNGTADTVYIAGGDMNATLNNSVQKLYVTARDANVTLTAGEFPVVYCDNVTAVITNKTDHPVTLIFPTGATTEIPANRTYTMATGKLTHAK